MEEIKARNQDKPWVLNVSGGVKKGLRDLFVMGEQPCVVYALAALHSGTKAEAELEDKTDLDCARKKIAVFRSDLLNATPQSLNFLVLALARDLAVSNVKDAISIGGEIISAKCLVSLACACIRFLVNSSLTNKEDCASFFSRMIQAERDSRLFYEVFDMEKLMKKLCWITSDNKRQTITEADKPKKEKDKFFLKADIGLHEIEDIDKKKIRTPRTGPVRVSACITDSPNEGSYDPPVQMAMYINKRYDQRRENKETTECVILNSSMYHVSIVVQGQKNETHLIMGTRDEPIFWRYQYPGADMIWQQRVGDNFLSHLSKYCSSMSWDNLMPDLPMASGDLRTRIPIQNVISRYASKAYPDTHGVFSLVKNKGTENEVGLQGTGSFVLNNWSIIPHKVTITVGNTKYEDRELKTVPIIDSNYERAESATERRPDDSYTVNPNEVYQPGDKKYKNLFFRDAYSTQISDPLTQNDVGFFLIPTKTSCVSSIFLYGGAESRYMNIFIGRVNVYQPFAESRLHKEYLKDANKEVLSMGNGYIITDENMFFEGDFDNNIAQKGMLRLPDKTTMEVTFQPGQEKDGKVLSTPLLHIHSITFPDAPDTKYEVVENREQPQEDKRGTGWFSYSSSPDIIETIATCKGPHGNFVQCKLQTTLVGHLPTVRVVRAGELTEAEKFHLLHNPAISQSTAFGSVPDDEEAK
jgi:hypothetical protein